MLKVKNMKSDRGNTIANQFIITDTENNITTFQSYDSVIISVDDNKKVITVHPDYNYSNTTGKYRNIFMRLIGLYDMANLKGFEYYMNLGAIGNYDIVTA